ncbi:MAG: hypothetical protein EAZ92_04960 [Candidatus Kapaibacterium sp.]|nr:MAG: hypothetical protein EAZ92_04960 [Candidatus Kapabacteria bacterium]
MLSQEIFTKSVPKCFNDSCDAVFTTFWQKNTNRAPMWQNRSSARIDAAAKLSEQNDSLAVIQQLQQKQGK